MRAHVMANVSIARRYARALLDASSDVAHADRIAQQLSAFVSVFTQSAELSDVLLNPAYTREQRMRVVEALMKQGTVAEPALGNLLRLLVDRNRLPFLPDIARIYRDLADARAGRVRGQVTSAVPLAPQALQKLAESLQRIADRQVVLESRVDPSVLGGVSAQVGSVLYDGTLRSQLEDMRRTLKQA